MTHTKTLSLLVLLAAAPTLGCSGSKADTATPQPVAEPTPVAEAAPAKAPVDPIPEGFHALTPQLTVLEVDPAVDFYVEALGAERVLSMPGPDGKTMHAEIRIGDSILMLDPEMGGEGMKAPPSLGGSPAGLMTYVDDVDAAYAALIAAGATSVMQPEDMFWGDRYAAVIDPFGHRWSVATHLEELTDEQMMQRAELAFAPPPKGKKAKAKAKAEPAWRSVAAAAATETRPSQYHTVTVDFTVADASAAIEFYKLAFGATELSRMPGPDGKLMHAEIKVGDSILMLADERPEMGQRSATTLGGSPVGLHYFTEDVDAAYAQATAAAARPVMPVDDMFWGDRYGAVLDPSGFVWGIATHTEDLSQEEMTARMNAQMAES